MQFGTPIRIEDLIDRFVKQVQLKCGLSQDLVFETLVDDADHCEFPPADRFITIQPTTFRRTQTLFQGADRFTPGYDAVFRVACICRLWSDQERRNTREVKDKVRSAMALALKVVDCLDGFQMADAVNTNQSYVRQPIGNIDIDARPRPMKHGWGVVSSNWDVKFVLALPTGTNNP